MKDPEAIRENLVSLESMVRHSLQELRKMVLNLRPSDLDMLGLVPAIRRYAEMHLEQIGMEVNIRSELASTVVDPQMQTVLFRVVQEAINNIARHSKASKADVRFWSQPDEIRVEVSDNGVGFDHEFMTSSEPSSGLGLLGMNERASLVDGQVKIVSEPGKGTKVLVGVPHSKGTVAL